MRIVVCPLSQVSRMVAAHAPASVISLLDPGFVFPDLGPTYHGRHLRLRFHDTHDGANQQTLATKDDVEQLLAFMRPWTGNAPLLIHCRAGIGRSTAAAFVAACLHLPDLDERAIAARLRNVSPLARPNEVLIRFADAAMGRGGRMIQAIEESRCEPRWVTVDENVPFEIVCAH
jgi:predicted protein tyrosine phosphatase